MTDVSIKYKGSAIANMSASGSKTLKTSGKYCEGDVVVQYTRPTASDVVSGSKTITANGTHDVTSVASAVVNVPIPETVVKYVTAIYNNTSADGNVAVTLISKNSFIAENYANDNAFALVVKLTNLQSNGQNYFMNTNKDFGVTASGGTQHTYGIWGNNSGTVVNAPSRTLFPLKTTATAVGHMYATSNGDLVVRAGGGISAFQTGNYFVMFGLMEG